MLSARVELAILGFLNVTFVGVFLQAGSLVNTYETYALTN